MLDNIERRARLACFVLELFPNIMRFSVLHYMLKKGLSNKYCNNIRYPSVFTTTELLLIQELPNVNNFTIQLCYKLITFEELLPTPSKGWGKFPDSNALKVEDDIERIRHGINEILTVNDEHFTECYLVKFLYKLEQIIQRLQIALGTTRVDSIYKSVLRKNIDTAVVLEELRNVDIIDSDATIIKLQDRERYSKIGAVITEFFPKILRINIPTWYSPLIVHSMCTQPGRYWNKSQKLQINTLQSSLNFESLDASMLYQLFRTFSLVPGPTQGWGKKPTESDKCTADDIERIHHLRNECAHRCDTCIDQATFDNYFVQFHKITHRIASDYEHELSAISRDSLDPKRQKELEEALQKLEDIKEQFRRKPMRFFWGNDMALLIKDIRQRIHREKDILGHKELELNSSIAKSLRLQFNVNMNAFDTDVSLESEIGACMERTITNLNGKGFNEDVTAIIHYVQSEDIENTHAIGTSPLIKVDSIVEMEEERTVDLITIEKELPSKRSTPFILPRQVDKAQKTGSLLLAPIVCDGYVIDCMIDKRLIDSQNFRKEKHTDFRNLKDDMAEGNKKEFQNLIMLSTFLKEKNQCLKPFYRELLMHTVKTKQNLLCRLTLSYCQERETELPYFLEALSLAIQEKEKECAKAIAWLITKMFFLANRVVLLDLIIDIWPALNCKCMIESTIQTLSTQFAIVVELENKTQNVPTKHFPVNVVYLDNEDVAKENPDAEKQGELKAKEKLADKKYITGQSAQKMFANHSKLTLMSKSIVLQHGIIKQCVDFFCKAKGLIPVGENPFPKSFCDMPTKVIQGCPVFMTNLRVGDMIGNDNKRGTVGGFVKVRGDTTFLTCLHLFMSAEELDAENLSLTDDKPVLISCFPAGSSTDASRNSSFVCGKIRDIAFITDNERSTSIDAALVKVKKHIEICPTDYVVNHGTENIPYDRIGLKSPFLNDNCVDYKQFCHPYLSCQIATLSFGAVTGTVKSICGIKDEVETCIDMDMSESSEERMDVDTLGLETAIYKTSNTVEGDVHWQTTFLAKTERKMLKRISRKMYGQIHISNIPFHPGDSGTCIYVTEPFQGCIGMGIANHPMGGCIATPIMEILKHFNIRCNSN